VDTHLHADHITGLGALRDKTHCITVMGERDPPRIAWMWRVSAPEQRRDRRRDGLRQQPAATSHPKSRWRGFG